jgi:hypothetical protein
MKGNTEVVELLIENWKRVNDISEYGNSFDGGCRKGNRNCSNALRQKLVLMLLMQMELPR